MTRDQRTHHFWLVGARLVPGRGEGGRFASRKFCKFVAWLVGSVGWRWTGLQVPAPGAKLSPATAATSAAVLQCWCCQAAARHNCCRVQCGAGCRGHPSTTSPPPLLFKPQSSVCCCCGRPAASTCRQPALSQIFASQELFRYCGHFALHNRHSVTICYNLHISKKAGNSMDSR